MNRIDRLFERMIPLGKRYMSDKTFRGRVGLYLGGFGNFLFILLNFLSGLFCRSVWFISIGFFYLALVFIKHKLARTESRTCRLYREKARIAEIKAYVQTGVLLFLLAFLISGIGTQVIKENRSYSYNHFLIYGVGAYAFYYMGITIYNMFFYKKKDSYIWSAVQAVNFTTALLGIYSFQTALLNLVSTNENRAMFNRITMIDLLIVIILKASFMIIKGKIVLGNVHKQRRKDR